MVWRGMNLVLVVTPELKRRERRAPVLFRSCRVQIWEVMSGGIRWEAEADEALGRIGQDKAAREQFAGDGLAGAGRHAGDAGHVTARNFTTQKNLSQHERAAKGELTGGFLAFRKSGDATGHAVEVEQFAHEVELVDG